MTTHKQTHGDPHPTDLLVGQNIRNQRILKGMSQERLAEAIGLTFQQVQKYEKGTNRVSASRLWAIADTLGVSLTALFDADTDALPDPDDRERRTLLMVTAFRRLPPSQQQAMVELARAMVTPDT